MKLLRAFTKKWRVICLLVENFFFNISKSLDLFLVDLIFNIHKVGKRETVERSKRGQKRAEINEEKREKRGSEQQIVGCKKVRNGAAN